MKSFIIGLFSLTLLAASTAWAAHIIPHPGPPPSCPAAGDKLCGVAGGAVGICNAHPQQPDKAILVILVTKTGDLKAYKCSMAGPGKPIEEQTVLPAGDFEIVKVGSIGEIIKYQKKGESDPCIEYTIGGQSRVFCWD